MQHSGAPKLPNSSILKQDVSDTVKPIEYPSILTEYPLHTEEEFNNKFNELLTLINSAK